MKNGLVLINSATSMLFVPSDRIRFIHATSATDIQINFDAEDNAEGSANITVTTGYAYKVLKELSRIISDSNGYHIVGDDVNSIYMPNVTAVAGVTINA